MLRHLLRHNVVSSTRIRGSLSRSITTSTDVELENKEDTKIVAVVEEREENKTNIPCVVRNFK